MNKIQTLFARDPNNRKHVLPEVTAGCEWVLAGEGRATRKFDGTCVLVRDGSMFKRREVKVSKVNDPTAGVLLVPAALQLLPVVDTSPELFAAPVGGGTIAPAVGYVPDGFEACGWDATTGKVVGWVPVDPTDPADKWYCEAAAPDSPVNCGYRDGTYELCGPKVQGNPEQFTMHVLVPHGREVIVGFPRDYGGMRAWLLESDFEGVVFWHDDGRRAKIKRRDFA